MNNGTGKTLAPYEDRRRWTRYSVDWPFYITGVSPDGTEFKGEGVVCNISVRGLLGRCEAPLQEGTRLQVYISLPLGTGNRIKYTASVVRVETGTDALIAVMFDKACPVFNPE